MSLLDNLVSDDWRVRPLFKFSARFIGVFCAAFDVAIVAADAALINFIAARVDHDVLVYPKDVIIAALIVWSASQSTGAYRLRRLLAPPAVARSVFVAANVAAVAVALVVATDERRIDYLRGHLALASSLCLLLPLVRLGVSSILQTAVSHGYLQGRQVVMVGDFAELANFGESDVRRYGLEEVARIGLSLESGGNSLSAHNVGRLREAIETARTTRAAEFALLVPWGQDQLIAELVSLLRASPLAVRLYPDRRTRGLLLMRKRDGDCDPPFSVEMQREPLTAPEQFVKRALDLFVAGFALVLFAPLFVVIALIIKFQSPGPVIFRQRRRGFDTREFVIWKFRTMRVMEDGAEIIQASRNDDRITSIGRILRKTSVDELPQLVNVLRGEMSLVGPRPHAVAHDDHYGKHIESYSFRHHVKPGLTGAAQVRGFRGETRNVEDMKKRIHWDIWYANNWSLWLDVRLICQTFLALTRHEAY